MEFRIYQYQALDTI